jgi:hypothetical protein
MSDESKDYAATPSVDDLFNSMFKPSAETLAYIERKNRECVPPEMADKFTVIELNEGVFEGVMRVAGCNKCGALVYPTALDRHTKFHEDLEAKE